MTRRNQKLAEYLFEMEGNGNRRGVNIVNDFMEDVMMADLPEDRRDAYRDLLTLYTGWITGNLLRDPPPPASSPPAR